MAAGVENAARAQAPDRYKFSWIFYGDLLELFYRSVQAKHGGSDGAIERPAAQCLPVIVIRHTGGMNVVGWAGALTPLFGELGMSVESQGLSVVASFCDPAPARDS